MDLKAFIKKLRSRSMKSFDEGNYKEQIMAVHINDGQMLIIGEP
jgi:hypothetical protein